MIGATEVINNRSNEFIPVNEPFFNGNEKKYLQECIDTGWISSEGKFVTDFENQTATLTDRNHGIAVSSGSAALDVALQALDLNLGDEVILPTFTIISCASAIIRAGAMPVLVDSDTETWNMDVAQIEEKITLKTKAIMVVHTYGLPIDMDVVLKIAKKYNLKIIEDAAEAQGQVYNGKPCGSFGDISIFSFYANKHVTTGEGGMILTDDEQLAEKCRSLRNLCFKKEQRFIHDELGFNYRMSNLQAAVGLAQLENLSFSIDKKRKIGAFYTSHFQHIEDVQLPLVKESFAKNVYWVYGLLVKKSSKHTREQMVKKLAQEGVGTRPFFWCMHEQPVFKKMGLFNDEHYPIAESLARNGFYIPSGLGLVKEQMQRVVDVFKEIFL